MEDEAPAARGLGAVHGDVGVAQQRLGVGGIVGVQADADAGSGADLGPGDDERLLQCAEQLAADALGRRGRVVGQVAEQDEELVAALAGQDVGVTQDAAQPCRDAGQQPVAGGVPQAVVDLFEVVEVDEHEGRGAAGAPGAGQRQVHLLLNEDPVGQPGQRVVVGQIGQLLLAAAALGDVAHDPVEGRAEAARALDAGDGQLHRELAAVAAHRGGLDAPVQQARARVVADPLGEAAVVLAIVRGDEHVGHLAAQDVLGQVVERALGGGVELDEAILLVHGDHAVQRRGDDRAVARQRRLQGRHLPRALDRQRGVRGQRTQHHQLLIVGPQPREGLVDRDDPIGTAARALQGGEQRVIGVPALAGELGSPGVGQRPVPGDRGIIEGQRSLGNEVDTVAAKPLVEQRLPRLGLGGRAEQDVARPLAAVDGDDLVHDRRRPDRH